MGYITQTKDYWIAPNAVNITLNALGQANRIQGSVASGAVIMCWIDGIAELGYDNGHEYRRWPLSLSPTYFNTDTAKYVYAAIPRSTSIGSQAVIVFPSEQLDINGQNVSEQQIGSTDYLYIYLHGIISEVLTENGSTFRRWTLDPKENWGQLDTAAARDAQKNTSDWFHYDQSTQLVTLLKGIVMSATSWFQNLRLGNKELTGVATATTGDEYIDSDELVATPSYINSKYLSKTHEDTAEAKITFQDGLNAKNVRVTGSNGTTPDTDNQTMKEVGLDVAYSTVIGGVLRVAKSVLTKTIQSLNFSGSDSLTGTGWQLTDDDGNGRSRLIVDDAVFRGRVSLNQLEVRKLTAMGGNYVFSPAASIIEAVDYYGYKIVPGEVEPAVELLGYEYIKVPWVLRLIPLSLRGRYLSRKKWVRSTMSAEDYARVKFYRCWLKADDGSTQTINTWQVGMLARCQTFDTSQIENGNHAGSYDKPQGSGGTYSNVTNKLYWRAVVAKGEGIDKEHYQGETIALDDGRKHNYIDLANYVDNGVQLFLTGSDHVSAGDHIVCFGDWQDRQLANLVTIETIGNDAPAVKEFVGVGYTGGTSIDWNLDGKMRTRISPTAGNRFIAPEFIIETDGGFVRYDECVGFDAPSNPKDGDVMLLSYDDISNDYQVEVWDAATSTWNDEHCAVGQRYYCTTNGHVYEATATGWKDLGIQLGQSVSSLKVGMDGIVTQVSNLSGNLSTLSQTVGGIETRVQNAEGNITTLNQTATGLTAEVTSIKQGKNLLSGVLTAQGWTDDTTADAACDAVNVAIKTKGTGATALIAPQVTLPKGSKYTLSFDVAGGDVTVQWSDGTAIGTATGAGRKTLVIDLTQAAADVTGKIKIFVTELSYPMLEIGEVATEFVADSEETSAFANLTSDRIQLAVQSALGLTGIDITHGTIELRGNKVVFTNSTGTITGKISIDPTTGTLIASDVQVGGKVTATSGKIAGFNISGNGLTNGPEYTNDAYIIFRNDAHKCFAGIGGNVLPASTAQRAVARFENEDSNDQWSLGANYAMILSAKNHSRKNVALQINHGQTRGLRPEVRGVNSNTTLTDDDHTIIATNGCTLTLPSSPQEGQQYHIVCMTTGTVKIQSAKPMNWKYLFSSLQPGEWRLGKGTEYDLADSVREAWLTFTGTEWHLTNN